MPDDILIHLSRIIDPELGVNIVDLELVYRVACTSNRISGVSRCGH